MFALFQKEMTILVEIFGFRMYIHYWNLNTDSLFYKQLANHPFIFFPFIISHIKHYISLLLCKTNSTFKYSNYNASIVVTISYRTINYETRLKNWIIIMNMHLSKFHVNIKLFSYLETSKKYFCVSSLEIKT